MKILPSKSAQRWVSARGTAFVELLIIILAVVFLYGAGAKHFTETLALKFDERTQYAMNGGGSASTTPGLDDMCPDGQMFIGMNQITGKPICVAKGSTSATPIGPP